MMYYYTLSRFNISVMLHFPNKQAFSSIGRALERWKAGAPTVAEMMVRARCDVRSNSDPPSCGRPNVTER
jgi:hypothetical protein